MNTAIKTILIVIVAFGGFVSCKKGEGDPLLSLRSRKARVAGDWTIKLLKSNSSYSNVDQQPNGAQSTSAGTYEETIDGEKYVYTSTSSNNGNTNTNVMTGKTVAKLSFKKDGTYTKRLEYIDIFSILNPAQPGQNNNSVYEENGVWDFLNGVGDKYKNKERMVLTPLSAKETNTEVYPGGSTITRSNYNFEEANSGEVWIISTLRNNQMEITGTSRYDSDYTYTSINSGGGSFSDQNFYKSQSSTTLTLSQ